MFPLLGPIMLDISSTKLNDEDRRRLMHPLTGGLILFTRNFSGPEQLNVLIAEIRRLRPELLIAVDQEGGRVQRFIQGFTSIPSMAQIGEQPLEIARKLAFSVGYILGYELCQHDIDFSFTPVLDINFGRSTVIGNRAFSSSPEVIGDLAGHLIDGLHAMGMKCCAKHFPGHGYATADSHLALPIDLRSRTQLETQDLIPYKMLVHSHLDSIMPAHVVYPSIDSKPAGFSSIWLQDILRHEMGFKGVVFSDDLSMAGAAIAGNIIDRAEAALHAGCDMILICNHPDMVDMLLDNLEVVNHTPSALRLSKMYGARQQKKIMGDSNLRYIEAKSELSKLEINLEPTTSKTDVVGNL